VGKILALSQKNGGKLRVLSLKTEKIKDFKLKKR
jgi:hypothetical protein